MERDFSLEIKALTEAGTFEGFASTFDMDDGGDRVLPGAFASTLAKRGRTRPILWVHDQSVPVGLGELTETGKGLLIAAQLDLDVTAGREAYSRVKKGIVRGLSIGFRTLDSVMEKGVRLLKTIDLFEVSLCPIPMNSRAQVTAVKSSILGIRDYEGFLHRSGWSKSEAKSLAGHGWAGLAMEPEPDADQVALLSWLRKQNRTAMTGRR